MESLAFIPEGESGWKGRGAPRKEVPTQIYEMLRRATNGNVGVQDVRDLTESEITELRDMLRIGGRHLRRKVHIQEAEDGSQLLFKLGGSL